MSLRELHCVIQVAMAWEGIHLYLFRIRVIYYGSWELSAHSPNITLPALKPRKDARFMYEYDLNLPWEHDIRPEDILSPESGQHNPTCLDGHEACPP